MALYRDKFIECDEDRLVIHWYYFPYGSKTVPYEKVKAFEKVDMTTFRGRGRIWGSANLRCWASLDPGRMRKSEGIVLDLGGFVRPFITPDDVGAVIEVLASRTGEAPTKGTSPVV